MSLSEMKRWSLEQQRVSDVLQPGRRGRRGVCSWAAPSLLEPGSNLGASLGLPVAGPVRHHWLCHAASRAGLGHGRICPQTFCTGTLECVGAHSPQREPGVTASFYDLRRKRRSPGLVPGLPWPVASLLFCSSCLLPTVTLARVPLPERGGEEGVKVQNIWYLHCFCIGD